MSTLDEDSLGTCEYTIQNPIFVGSDFFESVILLLMLNKCKIWSSDLETLDQYILGVFFYQVRQNFSIQHSEQKKVRHVGSNWSLPTIMSIMNLCALQIVITEADTIGNCALVTRITSSALHSHSLYSSKWLKCCLIGISLERRPSKLAYTSDVLIATSEYKVLRT